VEEHPLAETKPKKPGRTTRRTLAVVLLLAVAVWGVASLARPRSRFRFMKGFDPAGPPIVSYGGDSDLSRSVYNGRFNYDLVVERVMAELLRKGWIIRSSEDPGQIEFELRATKDWPNWTTLWIDRDIKLESHKGGDVSGQTMDGWTSIMIDDESDRNLLGRLCSRVREALHL
jgi:hypothetical protein